MGMFRATLGLLTSSLTPLLLCNSANAQSVLSVIENEPDLSEFVTALALSGLDSVLDNLGTQFTVFAPSNDAIQDDDGFASYLQEDAWSKHLRTNVQLMIVPDQALWQEDIFDGVTTELRSLNGTLSLSQPFALVNLVSIQTPDLQGLNGVVHIMDGSIKNYWREYTLRNVDEHNELRGRLSPILDRLNFNDPLNQYIPETGTSWIACRDRGYGEDAIAGGYEDIVQELQDPENADFQWDAYLYNLVDFNRYEQDIPRGYQALVLPRNTVAHMWITKDNENGILRFNDAELDRQALADNGITQIVKRPLVPPGLVQLMGYTAEYTTINMKYIHQFFVSSEWNTRNLSTSIATDATNFSIFCPLQDGFGDFNMIEVAVRLSISEWRRHLWDFLRHLMVSPARTTDEWIEEVINAGGVLSVQMVSGFNATFGTTEDQKDLTIDGAKLLRPRDMKGVDGYIHLIEQALLPPSVKHTNYDQIQLNDDTKILTRLIDTVQLGVFIDNLLPATLFAPIDSAWQDITAPVLEVEDLLKNMIFEALWFDDFFTDGQTIVSTNGKEWQVLVQDAQEGGPLVYDPERSLTKIYISNLDGEEGLTNCTILPGPGRTNVLTRTGIIHYMDCLFLDHNYTRVDPYPPTWAPAPVTGEPVPAPTYSDAPGASMYPSIDSSVHSSMEASLDSSMGVSVDSSMGSTLDSSPDTSEDQETSATRSGASIHDKGGKDVKLHSRGSTGQRHLIQTTLTFYFFESKGRKPTDRDISVLLEKTTEFFDQRFRNDPRFGKSFVQFRLEDSNSKYNGVETPDEFELSFKSYVILNQETASDIATLKQVATCMAQKHGLRDFVGIYARDADPGSVLLEIHIVSFRGVGSKSPTDLMDDLP